MQDAGISTLLILLLIGLHAWLEFAHAALVNMRRAPVRDRAEAGDRVARRLLRMADNHPSFLITKHITLMALRFAIAVIATVNLAEPFLLSEEAVAAQGDPFVGWVAFVLILLSIALATYILGDLVPSVLGAAWADTGARWSAGPLRLLMAVLRPLTAVLTRLDALIARWVNSDEMNKAITEEEIKTLVEEAQEGGGIEDEEKEMIYSILDFGETLVREVMVPRPDMVALDDDATLSRALKTFIDSGHSRIPIYADSLDDIKGILYAKDLLTLWQQGASMETPIRHALRPAYFVPETKPADTLFKEMQDKKVHIALIVDEYGGTAGLITIEDLIEEIVGDIRDEYDLHEEAEYLPIGKDEWLIDGGMNLDDVNELLEIDLPNDENDSVGGYVYSVFDRVPEVGETLDDAEHGITIRIEALDNRRIRKVYIKRHERPADTSDERPRSRRDGRDADTDTLEPVTVKDE